MNDNSRIIVLPRRMGKQVKKTPPPSSNILDDSIKLGIMIKHKRTSLKMSIKRTALLSGISDKSLQHLENGKNVKIQTMFAVMNTLGLKMRIDE